MSMVKNNQATDSVEADSKTIHIHYFASHADEANCHEEKVVIPHAMSLIELYEQLHQKYHFSRAPSELKVAINDYFAKWSDAIKDGDSVVFITPVAGG